MAKSFADRVRERNIDQSTQKNLDESAKKVKKLVGDMKDSRPMADHKSTIGQVIDIDDTTNIRPLADHKTTNNRLSNSNQPVANSVTDIEPTNSRPIADTNVDTAKRDNDPVWFISDRQSIILGYLIYKKDRVVKRNDVSEETGVSIGSIKKTLTDLTKYQFITKPKRWRNNGSTYSIYSEICTRFINERWPQIIKEYGNPPKIHQDEPTHSRPIADNKPNIKPTFSRPLFEPTSYSSSSSLENTTTGNINNILSTHPSLGYWRQKNLTAKQIEQWIKVAGCNIEIMVQYLCYCRYDMVDLNQEESKPVNNVFNWFFKILEKTGCYPKPKGYKSHQEKQVEAEKQLFADREKRIQELKELHRKKYEQERELEFWEMMSEPEGNLYKECFNRLSDFAKRKASKGGQVFEAAMRKAFDEIEEMESSC